jgi:Predicted membrane protein
VIATLCTFAGMLLGYKTGLIKVTDKSRRIFGMAIMGYLLFGLVNLVAAFMGVGGGWGFGGTGFMGIAISVLGVGLASYSLAIDFDSVSRAVNAQLPERYSWLLAHGFIVTLVWLYLEFLRLLARLRQ